MSEIFSAILTLKHTKAKKITYRKVEGVVVSGQDKDKIMKDTHYLKRACRLIGEKDVSGYEVVGVMIANQIGESNGQ